MENNMELMNKLYGILEDIQKELVSDNLSYEKEQSLKAEMMYVQYSLAKLTDSWLFEE